MEATAKILSDALIDAIREIVRTEIALLNEPQSAAGNGKPKIKSSKSPSALLDESEVAARLGVSRSTARRLILTASIPSITIATGRRKKLVRVRPEVLEAWMRSRENSGSPKRRRHGAAQQENNL